MLMNVLDIFFTKRGKQIKMMSLYLLASFVPMGLNLVTMPLFSLYMEKFDFAVVSYYNSFNSLLFPFILFYFNQYYMREFFYCDEEGKEKLYANMYRSCFFIPFIFAVVSTAGIYVYMSLFNKDSAIPFFPYGILTFFSIAFSGLYYIEQVELKNRRNAKGFLFLILFYSILAVALSLFFVIFGHLGALGKMAGTFISSIVMFVFLLIKNGVRIRKYKLDWQMLKQGIVFCTPLVFAAMLTFFSNGVDKVILEKVVHVDELGVYAIGISIGSVLSVFSNSIGNTFSPDVFESLASNNYKRMLKFVFVQIGIMVIVVSLFVLSARLLIIVFTANRYVEATTIARITSFSALTAIIYSIVSNVVFSFKKTKLILYTKIIGSLVCFGMYVFLINRFQTIGAAIGYVCGNLVFSAIALLLLAISLKKGRKI